MVNDLVRVSEGQGSIKMSKKIYNAMDSLRDFLFEKVYVTSAAKNEDIKVAKVLEILFVHYLENPEEMPEEFQPPEKKELPEKICDYIAGMTDRYALKKFEDLFLPKPWML